MYILRRWVTSKVRAFIQNAFWALCIIFVPKVGVTEALLVCFVGEGVKVVASIQNKSSREIKPKYCIYRKHSFFAMGRRRVNTKDLLKEVGEPIPPSTNQTVTRVINIPFDGEASILNCSIIKAEYRMRVSI